MNIQIPGSVLEPFGVLGFPSISIDLKSALDEEFDSISRLELIWSRFTNEDASNLANHIGRIFEYNINHNGGLNPVVSHYIMRGCRNGKWFYVGAHYHICYQMPGSKSWHHYDGNIKSP